MKTMVAIRCGCYARLINAPKEQNKYSNEKRTVIELIFHFKLNSWHQSLSPYGICSWIALIENVTGERTVPCDLGRCNVSCGRQTYSGISRSRTEAGHTVCYVSCGERAFCIPGRLLLFRLKSPQKANSLELYVQYCVVIRSQFPNSICVLVSILLAV